MADGDGFGVGGPSAKAARRSRPYVKFSAQLAREILRRAALGEPVLSICADDGMPSHNTVTVWARTHAAFGQALARAREAAAADDPGEAGFCQETARQIFARLCQGEGLHRICADPRMPGKSTVYRWRDRVPAFDRAVRLARDICAETVCEESLEAARAVTPETASALRVRLEHERWFVRAMAPHRFGPVRAADADDLAGGEGRGGLTVIVRELTARPGTPGAPQAAPPPRD